MTTDEALVALRDIQIPTGSGGASADVSLIAPFVVLVSTIILLFALWKHRSNAWRRDTKRMLDDIDGHARAGNTTHAWEELSVLLRRLVVFIDNRQASATETGEAWLHRLDTHLQTRCFACGAGRHLITAPYRREPVPDANVETEALLATTAVVRAGLARLRRPV